MFFFFKQKTAYEMRISDWSSDVCSSDLVWTSREGVEYAWFNNVETKPGIGYPKDWENQNHWNGGWRRRGDGKIEPRQGGRLKLLSRIFANPNLPEIDDYYEPFTFDYDPLQAAPERSEERRVGKESVRTCRYRWSPNHKKKKKKKK